MVMVSSRERRGGDRVEDGQLEQSLAELLIPVVEREIRHAYDNAV
jgi:hypothetical protein